MCLGMLLWFLKYDQNVEKIEFILRFHMKPLVHLILVLVYFGLCFAGLDKMKVVLTLRRGATESLI